MKRSILLVAAVAALAVAYFGSRLLAQAPVAPSAGGTRIAVVNIFDVFTKYQKAKFFKDEMDTTLKPYRDKAKGIKSVMEAWTKELQGGNSKFPKEDLENGLRQKKRELEDLDLAARREVGKRQEEQLVVLWKEVNEAVSRIAKAQGYQMVMAIGEPAELDPNSFPAISRKMQSFEVGASSPLYYADSVNITGEVVNTLNAGYAANGGAARTAPGGAVTPTSLQQQK